LSSSRSSSCSNHVGDHERRCQQPQEHGANHQQFTRCPRHEVMRTSLLHSHLHLLLMILLLLIKISPMMRLGLDQLLEPVPSCYNSR
jgi:hypothetical protein